MSILEEMSFRYAFEIAGVSIALNTERQISVSKKFQPFLLEENTPCEYEAFFRQTEDGLQSTDFWIKKEIAFDVGRCMDGRYCRQFRDIKEDNSVYATAVYDWEENSIEVQYLPTGVSHLNQSDNCFFHIAWETILQLKSRMILHACAIDTSFGGILFSGRSGIGKSTQGQLWCQYEDALPVNGDRPVLYKEEGIWYAYGSPYAGSSGYHINTKTAICAIVMLKQGKSCRIRRLNPAEAFRSVYAGLTISIWNPDCVSICCDQAEKLTAEIPVYELECTPDEQAVLLLKKTLQAEEKI